MDNIVDLLLTHKIYSISGVVIIFFFLLSAISKNLYENIKKTLWIATVLWVICFGYHAATGKNIGYFITSLGQNDTPAEQDAFGKYFSHSSVKDKEQ